VELSRGQRIIRVAGGAVFALILVILYAPFLIMGILCSRNEPRRCFSSDFSLISYQKLFHPTDFALPHPGTSLAN
jgi:ABC-type spermidine/putrescine transport system permease subunit II